MTSTRSEPSKLYVVEQPGVIRVLVNGKLQSQPFLDIHTMVKSGGEQGLLSLAFHPNYAKNHRFFVYFNDTSGDVRVYEFRSSGGVGVPGSGRSLLLVPHREFDNHNGGQLQFGPDGLLYAGTGDGGSGGDPHNHAQNLSSHLGKLLRLNVNKAGAKWKVAGYGLRNPWRFSWDSATRDLYIGDVGQDTWEEIDVRTPAQQRVLNNYGWRVWEGRSHYQSGQRTNRHGRLVFPIVVYKHTNNNCSVTGGYVYRGKAVPPPAAATSTATTAAARSGACARCTGSFEPPHRAVPHRVPLVVRARHARASSTRPRSTGSSTSSSARPA